MATVSKSKKQLTAAESTSLFSALQVRFEKHKERHPKLKWEDVAVKLKSTPAKLWSLQQMEQSGGEPDVVGFDAKSKEFIFFDCSEESPKGRRSTCYDEEARVSRKEAAPKDSALEMAAEMGIELLTSEQYAELQQLGKFDLKTSSWIQTPEKIRRLGGALFCDRRYDTVFTYHNGVQSYYAARGFRGVLKV
jgi:hypothetical protein